MSPKISVIVPVYKVEQYLPRCVDSILSQSFSDFELILVDDGSPDNSGKICDEYAVKDNRVRVFHKPNGGVSSARNWGLDNIQGEWVYFVDADDILFEDCLETLLIKDSEKYDCVIGGYINTNGERITSNIVPIVDVVWDYKKALLDFYTPIYFPFNGYLWNRLFRSSVIKQNNLRFRKDIFYKEDGLFVIEFICKSKKDVYVTTKPVYQYYINPNGAMQSLRVHFEPKYLTNMDARILCWENVREVTSWHDFKLRF